MSTRSIIRVMVNGEYRVCQYVQSDGYPTWRGVEVLHFVRDLLQKNLEGVFCSKIEASESIICKTPHTPRFDMLIGNVEITNETCTGAPTNSVRDQLLNKVYMARRLPVSESNPYGTKLCSWYEAIEKLFESGGINQKEAAWLAVAGRDSGIGALKWLMEHENSMTFYMPEDLIQLQHGGGEAGMDMIWGDYIIDLDCRCVVCGYHKVCEVIPFTDIVSMTDDDITKKMEDFEKFVQEKEQ